MSIDHDLTSVLSGQPATDRTGYPPCLSDMQVKVLRERCISGETATKYQLGVYNGNALADRKKQFGIDTYPELPIITQANGILIPYPSSSQYSGDIRQWNAAKADYWRVRMDATSFEYETEPGVSGAKVTKKVGRYLAPKGDVQPYPSWSVLAACNDVSVPIVITEAPIKALAVESMTGLAAIGMGGIHAGFHDSSADQLTLHKTLKRTFAWKGRTVYVSYDADLLGNPLVAQAAARLVSLLQAEKADVRLVRLPYREDEFGRHDQGPDDYMFANGAEAYRALVNNAESADPAQRLKADKSLVFELLDDPFSRAYLSESPTAVDQFCLVAGRGLSRKTVGAAIKKYKEELSAKVNGGVAKVAEDQETVLDSLLNKYEYIRSPIGYVYAREGTGAVDVDSSSFVERICYQYKERTGSVVTRDKVKTWVDAIKGRPLPMGDVAVRIARLGDTVYLDLGDGTQRVVTISPTGVSVGTSCPVPFFRPRTQQGLPEPVIPTDVEVALASLQDFRNLLGVSGEAMDACLVWLLSAVGMTGTFTILAASGEKGAGKSTRVSLLRQLLDPKAPMLTSLPATETDLVVSAENAHVAAFDNIRYVQRDLSDALCRLATGAGIEKRSLHTDRELTVFRVAKPLILNGIGDFFDAPDLKDRSVLVHFERVEEPLTEDEIWARFRSIHAPVLGALCFLASIALSRETSTKVSRDIRMMAPARIAKALEGILFDEGSVESVYSASKQQAATQAVEHPVVSMLLMLVNQWGTAPGITSWSVAPNELFDTLIRLNPRNDIKSARGLRGVLDHLRGTLRELGIEWSSGGTRQRPLYVFTWREDVVSVPRVDDLGCVGIGDEDAVLLAALAANDDHRSLTCLDQAI
jgi:hypothetical protein